MGNLFERAPAGTIISAHQPAGGFLSDLDPAGKKFINRPTAGPFENFIVIFSVKANGEPRNQLGTIAAENERNNWEKKKVANSQVTFIDWNLWFSFRY